MGEKLKTERGNVKLIIKGVERRDWRSHLEQQQRVSISSNNQRVYIYAYLLWYLVICRKSISDLTIHLRRLFTRFVQIYWR
jgi:hypothetical protein